MQTIKKMSILNPKEKIFSFKNKKIFKTLDLINAI